MKLNSMDSQSPMSQAHDDAIGGLRSDFEAIGKCFALDNKGMVTGGVEGVWQSAKDPRVFVVNGSDFAMHRTRTPDDSAAEVLPNALVPETNAEERDFARKGGDHVEAYASLRGRAGTRGNEDVGGLECAGLRWRDLVVAVNALLDAKLSEVLHEVVGE